MQKSMQIFTFLCIAAVVISWVVNLMLPSGFVGRLCERGSTLYLAVCNGRL